jgi:hypothetical protein
MKEFLQIASFILIQVSEQYAAANQPVSRLHAAFPRHDSEVC